ncbi:hypothetical protein ABEB36_005666 [Hypothenemus hampei]|uniref:Odorant receptor n=1 Tax=Hypothenemus hampei TaxID=57062 RepID=A0ABD1EZ10_HYPHA
MKTSLRSEFFKIPMKCAPLFGVFPGDILFPANKFTEKCYSIYSRACLVFLGIFLLTSYIQFVIIVFSDQIDYEELSRNFVIIPIFTVTMVRNILIQTPRFAEMIRKILRTERILENAHDKEIREICRSHSIELNRNIKIYLAMMIITEFSFISRPVLTPEIEIQINHNETLLVRELSLSLWLPFNQRDHFKGAYMFQIVYVIFVSCFETFGEFVLIAVIVFPIIQLKVLQHIFYNLEHYYMMMMKNHGFRTIDEAAFHTLKQCVDWHKEILNYVDEFNSLMSTCMFLDFIQSSLQIACVLIDMLTTKMVLMQFVAESGYLGILMFRLFLYYSYANDVIVMSQGLALAIYQSQWYEQSGQVKFMTFMLIMRNQKALNYKLGIFGYMSLNTYLSILHGAYSYVMLIYSVN